MQIEDKIKLILQGVLGPAHIVTSYDECLKRVTNEYLSIETDNSDIEELISDKYVRIYLYPYFQKEKSFELLIQYFIESSKDVGDIELFKEEVRKLIDSDNEEFINKYLKGNDYLISHSQIYRDNYHPHYLVINRNYLKYIYKN